MLQTSLSPHSDFPVNNTQMSMTDLLLLIPSLTHDDKAGGITKWYCTSSTLREQNNSIFSCTAASSFMIMHNFSNKNNLRPSVTVLESKFITKTAGAIYVEYVNFSKAGKLYSNLHEENQKLRRPLMYCNAMQLMSLALDNF